MRVRLLVLVTAVLFLSALILVPEIIEAKRASSVVTPVQGKKQPMTVVESIRNDTSPPVRDMKQHPVFKEKKEANKNPEGPASSQRCSGSRGPKATIATEFFDAAMPTPVQNFNGMQFPGVACNCAPPDTNGEVGATQYVQMVNEGFQVFDKTTGASLLGPSGIHDYLERLRRCV